MSETQDTHPLEVPCRVCYEPIKPGARLCRHCKSYQRAWRNWIPHIGVSIALVTFIASVMISGADIVSRHLRDINIDVVYVRSPTDLAILNNGGDRVLLEYLEIQGANPNYFMRRRIHQIVERGELTKLKLGGLAAGTVIKDRQTFEKVGKDETPVYYLKGDRELRIAPYRLRATAIISFRSTRDRTPHLRRLELEGYMVKLASFPIVPAAPAKP